MNKLQWSAIVGALTLFLALYLGFDTRDKNRQLIEAQRTMQAESTSFETLLSEARAVLSPQSTEENAKLEEQLKIASTPAGQSEVLKKISAFWYQQKQIAVAGGYAEQVAQIDQTAESWSVAGGTYFNGLIAHAGDARLSEYCASHAVKAFESAVSLAPEQVEHRVNLALVYAEKPPADQPMKAVTMLRDLEAKHPDAPAVYNALGRLAIKTGQWQRAVDRLEKAWSLDNKNPNTPCLLSKAYEGLGDVEKSEKFAALCR